MENVKILIIEDERRLSDSIKNYLESQDYLCEQAFNFNDAKLMAGTYDYDCVLLDLMLPGGDGLDILRESMLNNLIVNAVRHNKPGGTISIIVNKSQLIVANPSDEPPLDENRIFSRFYRVKTSQKGNGLGLAIVKSICDFHNWTIHYMYKDAMHQFVIEF